MRIVYIGCVESSYHGLKTLLEQKKEVVGVVTMESSGFNADFIDLSSLASKYQVPCKYARNINDCENEEFIRKCLPDVIYCFGWSQLIHKEILSISPLGVIGFHPAELPYNRGRHPLIWALALGLDHTASTFFRMDAGADTGDIISQRKISIEYTDYARNLYDKVIETACGQILEFTNELETGICVPKKQDTAVGNNWRKRGETDGTIDWRMSSRAIYNLVRALSYPYVGAQFLYKNKKIKVWKTEEIEDERYRNIEPGRILKFHSHNDFCVKAYDNVIHVLESDKFWAEEGEYL